MKERVAHILKNYAPARDCDKLLYIVYIRRFHSKYIIDDKIEVDALLILPNQGDIRRIRASIQNYDLMYLPTTKEVAIKRKINIVFWKAYMILNPV